jgi:dTDP-4-dehydrorhamnose reductase
MNISVKRVYIAGCGGMLGEAFYRNFKEDFELKCTDIDVNEKWLSYLDFRDFEKYKKDVFDFKPDYLFHLGAYTDLEYCELHREDTYNTNTYSVKNAVDIANKLDIPILYISSAGIFDGKKYLYDERDFPNPLGVYANSKYLGEKLVLKDSKHPLVCRAGWMMGGGPSKDKKFIQKIMKQIKEQKQELFVVNDKDGTPTYTYDFANNVKLLIKNDKKGLYNMVCGGETSRFEVAKEIIKLLNLENKIKITSVSSDYFKKEYFAERPPSERLVNRRLNLEGLNIMRNWEITLKEYLKGYYKNYLD